MESAGPQAPKTINWNQYRLVIEDVAPEDGGGFRAFYPTLGYAPLGCGETVEEALTSLEDGKGAVLDFLEWFGGTLNAPTEDDLRANVT